MPMYLTERHLPGITLEQLEVIQKTTIEMSQRYTAEGKPVRYLLSLFVPSESHCLSLFEAENAALVRDVNEAAQIPFTRILEAIDLTSQ